MALYKIKWTESATKELKKVQKQIIPKIIQHIEELSNNPRPHGCKKLSGSNSSYRIRIGDYRVIYDVFDHDVLIRIVKVGHRQHVYRNL